MLMVLELNYKMKGTEERRQISVGGWLGHVSVCVRCEWCWLMLGDEVSGSPLLNQQLTKFSHEVIEMLQHCPQCCLLFNRFMPTYHHHFGRQCRIANYGFTKLIELLDAIPHIVQVRTNATSSSVYLCECSCFHKFPVLRLQPRVELFDVVFQCSAKCVQDTYNVSSNRMFLLFVKCVFDA